MKFGSWISVIGLAFVVAACGDDDKSPTGPSNPGGGGGGGTVRLTAPALDTPADEAQLDNLRPTLTVRNGTSDQATGTRTYEFQISDDQNFTSSAAGGSVAFRVVVNKNAVPEGANGRTSFTVDADLQPTTRFFWRARVVQGSSSSDWSAVGRFKSKLMGYNRPGELYDPLIHGETIGQVVGSVTFIPGEGARLNNGQSIIRYALPQVVPTGEFSMDVKGLAPNQPGDKAKVFGMQDGTGDFITNDWRIDIQYRGTAGVPPNAIQWRAVFGDADDLGVRYEPDTAKRFASVFALNPATTYHWKATWGSRFHLLVLEGGPAGAPLYDFGLPTPRGTYTPGSHYALLGAPGASNESGSITGATYRNVWLSTRPRPASLGSALQPPPVR